MKEDIKPGYQRVTEILAPFSGMQHIPKDILKNASDRGTLVHTCCEAFVRGIPYDESIYNIYKGYMDSFEKYIEGKNVLGYSERLYSEKYMITGEVDYFIKGADNFCTIVDLKTSYKENKTWELQGAAYQEIAEENGFKIDKIEFVKLDKHGNAPTIYVYTPNFSLFFDCLRLYRHFYGMGQKEDFTEHL